MRPVCGWIKRGEHKLLSTNGSQNRLNVLGAFNLEMMTLTTADYETIDAASMTAFFALLQQKLPKSIINVALDQARYNTCKAVKAYLEAPRICLHHLPPYSPNLNAIEPCWKVMHEHVTYNRHRPTFKEFATATRDLFQHPFPANVQGCFDRLTDNFRILHSPLLPGA